MARLTHPAMDSLRTDQIFHGLADPWRLAIVQRLYRAERPLTCSEAVAGLEGLPVSTRSHCFRVLRECGLIQSEKRGRACFNSLRIEELRARFPMLVPALFEAAADETPAPPTAHAR